jgi:predicted MPP superfamily phosphohydrolase
MLIAAAAVSATFMFSLTMYAYWIEPIWLNVREVPLEISTDKHKTLRVIHVSDFHWGNYVSHDYLRRSFRTIAEQHPDVILITGDFINKKLEEPAEYAEALRTLSRAAPVYAVAGNHDGGAWAERIGGYPTTDTVRAALLAAGLHYLENAYECPQIRNVRVCIGGLGDPWSHSSYPGLFMGEFDSAQADVKILLMHNPDAKESVKDGKWNLILAGHTHGGQVDIPFMGARWVQVADKSMISGLYEYAGRPLFINPGVGSSQRRARLGCRPEVSILKLTL